MPKFLALVYFRSGTSSKRYKSKNMFSHEISKKFSFKKLKLLFSDRSVPTQLLNLSVLPLRL